MIQQFNIKKIEELNFKREKLHKIKFFVLNMGLLNHT